FLIDAVASINPYVSSLTSELDNLYIRLQEGNIVMGPLDIKAFEEYKARAKARMRLISLLWEAAERAGEKRVEKSLRRFIKHYGVSD
ncbi:MAG: hypothetical protein ACP5KY_04900, partial [Thermoproteus sp.]